MRTIGTFVDDTFRVNKALTLNLGVRFDHSVADLPGGTALDREGNPVGSDIPGIDSLFTWNSVSPRLGFAWKITGDGKNVLKGHYGKYYRGIITGEFDDVSPTISARYLFSGLYDEQGVPEDQELVSDNTNLAVDPDFKNPTTDQYIVGFERELAKNVGVQLNYVHKRGKDYGGYTRDARHLRAHGLHRRPGRRRHRTGHPRAAAAERPRRPPVLPHQPGRALHAVQRAQHRRVQAHGQQLAADELAACSRSRRAASAPAPAAT